MMFLYTVVSILLEEFLSLQLQIEQRKSTVTPSSILSMALFVLQVNNRSKIHQETS